MATLAARDQENAVRHLQAGPAGKSFNTSLSGLNVKTPGNKAPKTPFKLPLNDENAPNKAGKSVLNTNGKGNGNLFMTSKKGGKLDENAFVTPAGPRIRAPLGMKTTNAKSRPFHTPAPAPLPSTKTQKVSPRLRRPKVKVHQPGIEASSEDDVPEVEYMPPKEIPLEDDMDDYLPKDWNFPKIDHATIVRGILEAYHNPTEDDGRTRKQREFEEEVQRERRQRDEEFEKVFDAQMAGYDAEARRYFSMDEPKVASKPTTTTLAHNRTKTGVSTIQARSAAAALAPAANSCHPPRPLLGQKPAKPFPEPSASRQAAATAASKSTIGYAQGRAGRTGLAARKPLSNITKPAPFSATVRRTPTPSSVHNRSRNSNASTIQPRSIASRSGSSATGTASITHKQPHRTTEEVERKMEMLLLSSSNDEGDDAWMNNFNSQLQGDPLDDDLEGFQFQLPDGF